MVLWMDVIQVRDLDNSNYLILEGNRRVTTFKKRYKKIMKIIGYR